MVFQSQARSGNLQNLFQSHSNETPLNVKSHFSSETSSRVGFLRHHSWIIQKAQCLGDLRRAEWDEGRSEVKKLKQKNVLQKNGFIFYHQDDNHKQQQQQQQQ